MKDMFASADAGTFGLIVFVILFLGVVLWTLRPSARKHYQDHGNIPLREDQKNDG